MKVEPEIRIISPRRLIGMRETMNFSFDRTRELFARFKPRVIEIENRISLDSSELYCVQVYPRGFSFQNFDPSIEYEKWAAVEVSESSFVPIGMDEFSISGGTYAVYRYTGTIDVYRKLAHDFYTRWLPESGFIVDQRAHFEIMDRNYRGPADPSSTEEVWVPISRADSDID